METKSERICGACSVCCEWTILEFAPDKPFGEPCMSCSGNTLKIGRCLDYENRPEPCKKYRCAWLDGWFGGWFGAQLRPDVSGVLFEAGGLGNEDGQNGPKLLMGTVVNPDLAAAVGVWRFAREAKQGVIVHIIDRAAASSIIYGDCGDVESYLAFLQRCARTGQARVNFADGAKIVTPAGVRDA